MNKGSQAIMIGKDFITEKFYILNDEWPAQISVTPNLLGANLPCLVVHENHLIFTLANGTAKYAKKGNDRHGNLVCQRVSSTYKKQAWPPCQP